MYHRYLRPILVKAFKLPIDSGMSMSSLCCRSRVDSWIQLPISLGKCSKWLCDTSNMIKLINFPIPAGKSLILFSLKLSIVKFYKKCQLNISRTSLVPLKSFKVATQLTVKLRISSPTTLILLNLRKRVVSDVILYTTSGIWNIGHLR